MMASYNLNEILKKRALQGKGKEKKEMDLGDTARVKVLSPMRQVMKRFLRNRLAIFGTVVLLIMFLFAFVGPLFLPYGEAETMYKYEPMVSDYAFVQVRTEYNGYVLNPEVSASRAAVAKTNSNISQMVKDGKETFTQVANDGFVYLLSREGQGIYTLSQLNATKVAAFGSGMVKVASYDGIKKAVSFEGAALGDDFVQALSEYCKGKKSGTFELNGVTYTYQPGSATKSFNIFTEPSEGVRYTGEALSAAFETAVQEAKVGDLIEVDGKRYVLSSPATDDYEVYEIGEAEPFMVYTTFAFDSVVNSLPLSNEFKAAALAAVYGDGAFEAEAIVNLEAFQKQQVEKALAAKRAEHHEVDPAAAETQPAPETESAEETGETGEAVPEGAVPVNAKFNVAPSTEREGVFVITLEDGTPYAELNNVVVRRYNGDDTMDLDLKHAIRDKVAEMMESGAASDKLEYRIPKQDEKGKSLYDEEGVLQYEDSHMTVKLRTTGEYVVSASQTRYLIDKFAAPSTKHFLGTDGDGFDVLARIMYGGRISLLVGFVVVFIECFLGIIMGGLAGFFGGWIDNLVMRLVDIFYCLPFMPIMIIVGALMDAARMDVTVRLFVLMAAMGIMGWAGIARLVRGQILSLREQEFMTAAEATGLPTTRRIFRHLVPNVMPQLIVSATMGLGSTILSESALSFLGLGVKHPLATWGSMINSVASASAMEQYAYIWIPVGLLICFTVIAFNFVGDGLRDAFDPKAKR